MTESDMAVGTGVRADWVTYAGDGVTVTAYLTQPAGSGPWPGLVMVHENPGLTENRQEVSRLLSAEGYAVITPNLFSRIGGEAPAGDDHDRHLKIGAAVPDEQVFGDLVRGHQYLLDNVNVIEDRIGIIGFCMGGSKGLYTACRSDRFCCFVDFYGPIEQSAERYGVGRSLLPLVKDLSCPIQLHSGDKDRTCTPEQHQALKEELARHGKNAECYLYAGAQHGFHGDGERHHAESAVLAWGRALEFLARHLKAA
jgi:carboxymethylenebutenolidase